MLDVVLTKAVVWPVKSRNVHRSGTVLTVTAEEADELLARGVIEGIPSEAALGQEDAEEAEADSEAVEEADDDADDDEADIHAPGASSGEYGPLPAETEPASVWKEYARAHDISLTGLTKKPEIIGFVTKVVEQS